MSSRSEQIRERLFEVIHNCEMENSDLVKIFEHIGNDILNLQTKSSYGKNKGKCYNAYKFSKAEKATIRGMLFICDNDGG